MLAPGQHHKRLFAHDFDHLTRRRLNAADQARLRYFQNALRIYRQPALPMHALSKVLCAYHDVS